MNGKISYDLLMEDDMSFVEGSYRLANGNWQVFIFRKDDVDCPEVTAGRWSSGVTGLFIRVPLSARLNKELVQQMMSKRLKVHDWHEERGPDSMQLR